MYTNSSHTVQFPSVTSALFTTTQWCNVAESTECSTILALIFTALFHLAWSSWWSEPLSKFALCLHLLSSQNSYTLRFYLRLSLSLRVNIFRILNTGELSCCFLSTWTDSCLPPVGGGQYLQITLTLMTILTFIILFSSSYPQASWNLLVGRLKWVVEWEANDGTSTNSETWTKWKFSLRDTSVRVWDCRTRRGFWISVEDMAEIHVLIELLRWTERLSIGKGVFSVIQALQ